VSSPRKYARRTVSSWQNNCDVASAVEVNGLDQPLLAQVAQVALTRVGRAIVVVWG
jgi:hypothetical protein